MKRLFYLSSLIALLVAAGAADLRAQNVVTDKDQVTLSAVYGGAAVSGTVAVTSSTGAAINFVVFANNAWIKVNGQNSAGGTTPSTITVQADPASLAPGTYNGSILVVGPANNKNVAVVLTVSSIGVSPSSVAFSGYTAGSLSIPPAQTVTLSGVSTQFTAAASTTNGGAWLHVTPSSGSSPGAITVQLDTAIVPGLGVGTYNGQITVTPVGGSTNIPVNIQVTLTVSSAPQVTVIPSPLQFSVQIGGTNNITSQSLTIASSPAAQVGYSLFPDKNWITANPSSGATDAQSGTAQVTVGVNPTNLAAGTYSGQLTLFMPGATPPQAGIPVNLAVFSSPILNVPPAPLTFTYQLGTAAPAAQNMNITATSGTLSYNVAVSSNASWLSAAATGSTAAPLSLSVNPTGLAVGSYVGTLTITSAGAANSPQTVNVTLKVTNDPMLVADLPSTSFPYQIGQASPAAQLVNISSSTGAVLNFTATLTETTCSSAAWLFVNGAAGTVSGSTPSPLTLSVNPAGLAAGTCQGKITIAATVASTGASAFGSPLVIPVTLDISNTPLLVTAPAALKFTASVGAQSPSPQNITLTSTSPAAADQLSYSVTFQTDNGGTWLFAAPLSGATTAPNNVVTVSVIPTLLSPGTYTGSVIITASGAAPIANSPVKIPVTLMVAAGALTLSPPSLSFTSTLGGARPAPKTVTVGSTGSALIYSAAANNPWLSVTPPSGSTASNNTLTIAVDPTGLPAGSYTGSVSVSSPLAGNSPQTINVTLTVQPGTISAPTATLTFNQLAGGPAPAAQTIAVTSTPGPLSFTAAASQNTPWLTVSPATGTTPGSVQVKANAGNLAVGQYNGSVIITSTGAAGSPITVPVVLNVSASRTLSANPPSLTFNSIVGQAAPASQGVDVTISGGGSASVAAQVSGAAASWLSVSPASGTTPAHFVVSVIPGTLSAGTYNGSISVTSPSALAALSIPVTLTVVQVPKPLIAAISNAASYSTGGISPGENIVIFGTGIGPGILAFGTVANGAWGTVAGNTRVLFDGVPAPIYYASDTQTSVWVPYGVNGRTTTNIVVEYSGVQSNAVAYNVVATAPGIYTLNFKGTGPGAILNQNYTVNSPAAPEKVGNVVAVYMTGEGQTSPGGVDGAVIPSDGSVLKKPLLPVTATIGGVAADVLYAGSAPGLVSGLMQVNLRIPAGVATGGAVPIQIAVGGTATQTGVTIAITQ